MQNSTSAPKALDPRRSVYVREAGKFEEKFEGKFEEKFACLWDGTRKLCRVESVSFEFNRTSAPTISRFPAAVSAFLPVKASRVSLWLIESAAFPRQNTPACFESGHTARVRREISCFKGYQGKSGRPPTITKIEPETEQRLRKLGSFRTIIR